MIHRTFCEAIILVTLIWRSVSLPNIVLIVPDDIPFYWPEAPSGNINNQAGVTQALLPNIKYIRENGAVMKFGYGAGVSCAPSRTVLMTGRYCSRSDFSRGFGVSSKVVDSVVTHRYFTDDQHCSLRGADVLNNLPNLLHVAPVTSYFNIASGKWDLSSTSYNDYPGAVAAVLSNGFDAVGGVYQDNMDTAGTLAFSHNMEWMTATVLPQIDEAIKQKKPFFLYFTPTTPHAPSSILALTQSNGILKTPAGTLTSPPVTTMPARSTVISRAGGNNNLAGSIWADDAIGAVMKYTQTKGVFSDTYFIVMMDNNQKNALFESSTRLMVAVMGPSIAAGQTAQLSVNSIDILPTILEMAGVSDVLNAEGYSTDGVSWLGMVNGRGAGAKLLARECLFTEFSNNRAIKCNNNFKYISAWTGTDSLYNLAADPTEKTNLISNSAYAVILKDLKAKMAAQDALVSSRR
jgi:arylsulfatase A-like enzyme